jgi:hypothetical protein
MRGGRFSARARTEGNKRPAPYTKGVRGLGPRTFRAKAPRQFRAKAKLSPC